MVGSYPRPLWYKHQLHGQDIQHAFKLEEHAQAYEDATVAALSDQDLAGLDVVADGQMYFDDYGGSIGSFVWYWYERLPGFYHNKMPNPIAMSGGTNRVDFEMMNNWGGTTTVGKIERGPARLAELYQMTQRHTKKPLKVSVGAGPLNLSIHVHYDSPEAYYKSQRELVADLVPVFNAELKELVAAGAEFIQLEDLGAWIPIKTGRQEDFKWVVDSMNEMVDGVEAKLAWHFCLGTAYGNTLGPLRGKTRRGPKPSARRKHPTVCTGLRPAQHAGSRCPAIASAGQGGGRRRHRRARTPRGV
jgi:5-methyltetrahydropteroyltriglutamate--homocysteine methyltransferase